MEPRADRKSIHQESAAKMPIMLQRHRPLRTRLLLDHQNTVVINPRAWSRPQFSALQFRFRARFREDSADLQASVTPNCRNGTACSFGPILVTSNFFTTGVFPVWMVENVKVWPRMRSISRQGATMQLTKLIGQVS